MRIAIVNDMATAVEVLRRSLAESPHEIAWIARSGEEAVRMVQHDRPDMILMDMVMPGMNGAETTRRIMEESACAVLIVTASIRINSSLVFEAIGNGALDAVRTPTLSGSNQTETTATLLGKISRIEKLLAGLDGPPTLPPPRNDTPPPARRMPAGGPAPLIGVGASAGGPAALATLFAELPRDFPAGFVVVQHLDHQFMDGLVEWLDEQTEMTVRAVEPGDQPTAGTVLIAAGTQHLMLGGNGLFKFSTEPKHLVHRPSIDVFFKSCARKPLENSTFLLLTGMRRDGAQGLLELRQAGCRTIAQDAATCAVYGMPKAAVELGAAQKVLSIHDMPDELRRVYCASPVRAGGSR
ncbi:MAG: chemotaxis-specific protein-glutamate methyltransferase CheB [Planctomycetota bacterium]